MSYTDCWWFTTASRLYLFNNKKELFHEKRQHVTKVTGHFSIKGIVTLSDYFEEAKKIKENHPYITSYHFHLTDNDCAPSV